MSNHKELAEDEEFGAEMSGADPEKLIVVDFSASWCGPCQKIHPVFIQMAHKFPRALFLGVDVDLCRETAMDQGVSAMPTFMMYKNKERVATVRGAHPQELEEKIRQHYGHEDAGSQPKGAVPANALADIFPYIAQKRCDSYNDAQATPFHAFLEGRSVLKSDLDEQLILSYGFTQPIKLHSFKIKSTVGNGPKLLLFFLNEPSTLDFRTAASIQPAQEILLHSKELDGKHTLEFIRSVRKEPVRNLQIFVATNQNSSSVTQIDSLTLYGGPILASTTNLHQEFKKLALSTAATPTPATSAAGAVAGASHKGAPTHAKSH